MMTFDRYRDDYKEVVQQSIAFAGLPYDFFVKAKTRIIKELISRKRDEAAAGTTLLDVGCGIGTLHRHLADTFAHISGADVSEQSIEEARALNPNFDYRVMVGAAIPYADAMFDMVTAINVIHHIDPGDWRRFTSELKRVLRPGGLACIIEHNPLNPLTRLAVLRCPFDQDAHLLKAPEARRLLMGAGFAQVRSSYFLLTPFSSAAAYGVERWLGRLPLGAQYVAVGERPMSG